MIEQLLIAITTIPATFMTQSRNETARRWACIAGLAGEPFWFFTSYRDGAWGVFATAVVITGCWLYGVWVHWMQPNQWMANETMTNQDPKPLEIRYLGEMQLLRVAPDDVFVLMLDCAAGDEEIASISASWRAKMLDRTLIVLPFGARLGVISAADAAEKVDG